MELSNLLNNVYLTLSVATFFILCWYLNWRSNYWKRKGVNGPKSLPLVGTLWEHLFQPLSQLEMKRYTKYGRIYGSMQGWLPVLTIGEPELIKQIRITDFRYFVNHRQMYTPDCFMSKNLVDLKDSEWKRVRNILSPVFTSGKLKAMQPLINRCIQNTLQHIEEIADDGREIDLKKLMMAYTMNTIAACAFAMKTNVHKEKNSEFRRNAENVINIRVWRMLSSLLMPYKVQDVLNIGIADNKLFDYFRRLLKMVIDERKEKQINQKDFVKLMIDAELTKDESELSPSGAHKKLTDEEIMAQSTLFFVVGYETTSTLLQYTLYALSMNPKVQQTLFEEISNYFKENETIDCDTLMSLPYFDAVINESLRLYTPVTIFEHVCGEDYKLGDTGITIEKGTVINMPYYAMHHDQKLFPDPYEFKPERFLPEHRDQIQPCSFLPFGTGPRICIGMRFAILSAKLMIANFVNKFEVIRTQYTASKPEFNDAFVFLTCKPLIATFKKRDK